MDFDYSRSLSDDVAREVDWFNEELRSRLERKRVLREAIRYAKDVAGVEPYFRREPEDDE